MASLLRPRNPAVTGATLESQGTIRAVIAAGDPDSGRTATARSIGQCVPNATNVVRRLFPQALLASPATPPS